LVYFYSGKKGAQEWADWRKRFKAATGRELEDALKQDLYAVAKRQHWLHPEEYKEVQSIVAIRNAFLHFNPWEVTIQRYHKALQWLGLKPDASHETIGKAVLQNTISLLEQWFPRLLDSRFGYETSL
jgi:hypothetical protein